MKKQIIAWAVVDKYGRIGIDSDSARYLQYGIYKLKGHAKGRMLDNEKLQKVQINIIK